MACVAAEDYHSADYPLPDIPPRATSLPKLSAREPDKAHIRKLAEFFGVPADLFR